MPAPWHRGRQAARSCAGSEEVLLHESKGQRFPKQPDTRNCPETQREAASGVSFCGSPARISLLNHPLLNQSHSQKKKKKNHACKTLLGFARVICRAAWLAEVPRWRSEGPAVSNGRCSFRHAGTVSARRPAVLAAQVPGCWMSSPPVPPPDGSTPEPQLGSQRATTASSAPASSKRPRLGPIKIPPP